MAEAVERPHDHDALYFALDMTDAISRKAFRDRLETSEFPQIERRDFDRAADDVSRIRLISFSASVVHGLHGRCTIEFSRPPSLAADLLKGMFLEILDRRGAAMPDLASWHARIEDSSLILSGPISAEGMDDIVSFLSSPGVLADQERAVNRAEESANDSPEQQTLRATKAYFHTVTSIIERLRNGSAKTQGERALGNDRFARQIDQLPMLHVDPEMLDYGAKVATLMRGAGVIIRESNIQAGATIIASPTYSRRGRYAVNNNAGYNAAMQSQARAKGIRAYLSNLKEIDNETSSIRRAMTTKYDVEF